MDEKKLQKDVALLATQLYPPGSMPPWIVKDIFYKEAERNNVVYRRTRTDMAFGQRRLLVNTKTVYENTSSA